MGKIGWKKWSAALLCALALLPVAGALSAQAEQAAEKPSKPSEESDKSETKDEKKDSATLELLPLLPKDKPASESEEEDTLLSDGVTATGKLESDKQKDGKSKPRSASSLNVASAPAQGTVSSSSTALSRGKQPAKPAQAQALNQSNSGAVEVIVGPMGTQLPSSGMVSASPVTVKNSSAAKPAAGTAAAKPAAKPSVRNWPPAAPAKNKTQAAKPATKPAAQPASRPAADPVQYARDIDNVYALHEGSDIPAPETGSLRDYFSDSELLEQEGDSFVSGTLGNPDATEESPAETESGIIQTTFDAGDAGTVGGLLGGRKSSAVGGSVPRVSPARSIAIVLACLALVLAGGWLSKKKGLGLGMPSFSLRQNPGRALSIVETVSLGQGRQITIVSVKNEALVLGVTGQQVTLLEKFPLSRLDEDYRGTVESLIDQEEHDESNDWRRLRSLGGQQGASAARAESFGQPRTISIDELRRARASMQAQHHSARRNAGSNGSHTAAPRSAFSDERATRDGLISRIREHLDRMEG